MDEIDALLSSLHEHLEATADQPLTDDAQKQVDEAVDTTQDLATGEIERETAHERVETVLAQLDEIDETGDQTADEHVEAARRAAQRVLQR